MSWTSSSKRGCTHTRAQYQWCKPSTYIFYQNISDIFNKNLLNSLVQKKKQMCLGWISRTLKNSPAESSQGVSVLVAEAESGESLVQVGSGPTKCPRQWHLGLPIIPFVVFPWFPRWWFQVSFIFIPTWGNDPIWLIFFKWVETTNQFWGWFVKWHRCLYISVDFVGFWRC